MFAYLVFFGVDGEVPEWNLVNIETEWLERPLTACSLMFSHVNESFAKINW
jgi:hypothetical protein